MNKKKKIIIMGIAVIIFLIFSCVAISSYANYSAVKSELNLGYKFLEEGNYQEAILAFNKVIEIQPKNIEARIGLAKAYVGLGQPDEAEKVLKEAIAIAPKKFQPYLELASLYLNLGKTDEALSVIETGYKETHEQSLLNFLKDFGNKYLQEGRYELAIPLLEKIVEIIPADLETRLALTNIYTALWRYKEAEEVLRDGINIMANEPQLYLALANIYLKQARLDDAITLLQEGYKATNDPEIKELLDELLQEKQNGGMISEKAGQRLINDYANAKTYHIKSSLYHSDSNEQENAETWIKGNMLRTDYKGIDNDRSLIVKDGSAVFYYYKNKEKEIAVVDAQHYLNSYLIQNNDLTLVGKDDSKKGLLYDFAIDKSYDIKGAPSKFYEKNIIYCVSRRGIEFIKLFGGTTSDEISEHIITIDNIELNQPIDDSIFNAPF